MKLNDKNLAEASVIYDKATDVGYPALPMDISLAEAIIGSVKHKYQNKEGNLQQWETKLYYNNITHKMDDTKRASVPIHMDMPGYSTTYGYYSKLNAVLGNHHLMGNLAGFSNRSLADMTMFPNIPGEKTMYMLTWPDVKTLNQSIFIEDRFKINDYSSVKWTGSLTMHQNKVDSEMGLESLQIFYPEMTAIKNRILKSTSLNYNLQLNTLETGFGIGYGERAPSVSEGYGFYLFNSAEKYDYIGNPYLKNETSMEANFFFKWKNDVAKIQLNSSYFKIKNYIVGEILPGLVPMTIGALGVKKTSSINTAYLYNIGLNTEIKINHHWQWKGQISYYDGKDNQNEILPMISPIRYSAAIEFRENLFTSELNINGNTSQKNNTIKYGETPTASYAILNLNIGYPIKWNENSIQIKTGIENLLDTYYTTYSDWNKIPRPGRNAFVHLSYIF